MRIFRKIRGTEAQHAIEYAILLTLIMAGIIIAGPYTIRSWNANLKGWEDSVQDSLQDPLLEVPSGSIPITGCDPQPWVDGACGGGALDPCTGATFSCGLQEMLMSQPYNPAGCQCAILPSPPVSLICEVDDSNHCCTPWAPNPPTIADCGINATPPCPDGQYRANHVCDTGYTETTCIPHAVCVFVCHTPPQRITNVGNYGAVCPGDENGLLNNTTNYSYVNSGACSAPKCQIQCAAGSISYGTFCAAPCPPGWVHQGSCGGGFCDQDGCGAGYCPL